MAKRRGVLEDLFEIGMRLSWQASVGLAVVTGLGFHFVAAAFSAPPTATSMADMGAVAAQHIIYLFAYSAQFILPAVLLIGAAVSFLKRGQRNSLFAKASVAPRETVAQMDWRRFEMLVGEAFRRDGYQVIEQGGSSPDGGVDLVVTKAGERFLVQCKHWRAQQVGVNVVRELHGVVAASGVRGGIAVTSGRFTQEAEKFAASCGMRLIDGMALERMIKGVGTPAPGSAPSATLAAVLPGVVAVLIVGAAAVSWMIYSQSLTRQTSRRMGAPSLATPSVPSASERLVQEAAATAGAAQEAEEKLVAAKKALAAQQSADALAQRKRLAWERYYKAPDSCEHPPEWKDQVECGNKYIRAKREFEKQWRSENGIGPQGSSKSAIVISQ